MKTHVIRRTLLVSLIFGLFAALVDADITLLNDTFDLAVNNWDMNYSLATRQTGIDATVNYEGKYVNDVVDDKGWLLQIQDQYVLVVTSFGGHNPSSFNYFSPSRNFTNSPPRGQTFFIELDLRTEPSGGFNGWFGIVVGADAKEQFVDNADGVGIFLRENGNYGSYIKGVDGGGGTYTDTPDVWHKIRIAIETANFNNSPATVRMYTDDVEINSWDVPGGFDNNYISLMTLKGVNQDSGNRSDHIDNLTIGLTENMKGTVILIY